MSQDVLTVGSTMRIPLLYRGEYSQWSERFMNYLEVQTNGEAMINSIKNDDQPLPRVTQVSIAGTSSTEQPPLKDKSMCNKTAKDLWDSLARHMLGSEYGEQERKAAVLYEYETFKATEGELLLDTYKKEKVVVSSESEGGDDELKKITALLAKAFNRKKFYSKPTNNNLRTSSATSSVNKKQEYVKSDDKKEEKKVDEKKRDMSKVRCYNCKKKGHFAKDCKKAKVKDYGYYKIKMLLAKKDKDEQVLLAEDHAWMESSSDLDEEINANMVFMAQIEKVLPDSEASSSSSDDKIAEVSYYTSESESEFEYETLDYYDNSTTYGLFVDNNDDQENFHDSSKKFSENLIESQIDHNKSDVTHNDSEDVAKLINQIIKKFDKKIDKNQKCLEKANQQSKDFENQTKFFQEKCEASKVIISFIKKTQVNLQLQVQRVRTDNGTEFKNKTLAKLFDRNRTLVEVARTMLTFANLPLFLWAEAIATACFTQNLLIIHKHFDKTPYELMNKRKPNIKFSHVFERKCYLLNDYDDIGKLKAKGDIGMFVGYSKESDAFRVYNKRTPFHDSSNAHTFYQPYPPEKKWTKDHPLYKIIGDSKSSVRTRGQLANLFLFSCLLSSIEPANVAEALRDADWVSAMQDKLDEFTRLKVWRLVPRPEGKTIIKTKCIFKNKKDERSLVIQSKARLVAVGYSQQEGINYDETFAPVARIKAIRLFLEYDAHKDVIVFQIDVKITFLNRILKEEVYVGQPPGFVSKQYPDHVYALDKALYDLKQAPRAWYDVLLLFLIESGFQK
nr:retrovirus-related Pol polyprotein from transposon TNT 1-94 [Tanacetum cinerariifolium]